MHEPVTDGTGKEIAGGVTQLEVTQNPHEDLNPHQAPEHLVGYMDMGSTLTAVGTSLPLRFGEF